MSRHVTAEGFLLPRQDEDGAPFWEGTARGELRMQTCAGCDRLRFPPRPMCPRCRSMGSTWEPVSGRGTIWSFVVPHPPLLPGYQDLAPYNVILVALDEDPTIRLTGNLVTGPGGRINEISPSSIRIGARVRVVFPPPLAAGIVLPRWILDG